MALVSAFAWLSSSVALVVSPEHLQGPVSFAQVQAQSAVAAAADHRIRYGESDDQYGLLWLPKDSKAAPLVILIHGGCYLQAYDVSHIQAAAGALRDQGFAVWAPEYRRAKEQQPAWPAADDDVRAAVRFAQQLPYSGIDSQRTILIGHSAGGHLALRAAQQPGISAVIGLAAITDLTSYAAGSNSCQQAAQWFIGGAPSATAYTEAYAAAAIDSQGLPAQRYLLASRADTIVPSQQAEQLPGAEVIWLEHAGHFDFIAPGSAAWHRLLSVLAAFKDRP